MEYTILELETAILHCKEKANELCGDCKIEHMKLLAMLEDLYIYKKTEEKQMKFYDKNGDEIKNGMFLNGGSKYTMLYGYPKFRIGEYEDKYLTNIKDEEDTPVKLWGIYLEFQDGEARGINAECLKTFKIL